MKAKICGLTRLEDAQRAQMLGAWALGFIFYPPSKRHIAPAAAADIIGALQAPVRAVGVFVNQMDDIPQALAQAPLAGVQLHGDETPADGARLRGLFGGFIIKAFRPQTEADLDAVAVWREYADYILIDAAVPGAYGGTGRTADWALAACAAESGLPVILSGGITPGNAAEAAAAVRPVALDLASGVESAPGVKDHGKLEAFFKAMKDIDHAAKHIA